jgi:hypothetical protein
MLEQGAAAAGWLHTVAYKSNTKGGGWSTYMCHTTLT